MSAMASAHSNSGIGVASRSHLYDADSSIRPRGLTSTLIARVLPCGKGKFRDQGNKGTREQKCPIRSRSMVVPRRFGLSSTQEIARQAARSWWLLRARLLGPSAPWSLGPCFLQTPRASESAQDRVLQTCRRRARSIRRESIRSTPESRRS